MNVQFNRKKKTRERKEKSIETQLV